MTPASLPPTARLAESAPRKVRALAGSLRGHKPCPCPACTEARRLSTLARQTGLPLAVRPRLGESRELYDVCRTDLPCPLPVMYGPAEVVEAELRGMAGRVRSC